MKDHWETLDKEITDDEYQFDRAYMGKITLSQNPKS